MQLSASRQLPPPLTLPWQPELAQLLEEHHLVAWSPGRSPDQSAQRGVFAGELSAYLARMDDTQVCRLDGRRIVDLSSFCSALSESLGGEILRRRSGASLAGVAEALRDRADDGEVGKEVVGGGQPSVSMVGAMKRRYIVWSDADVLLRADHELFGRLVDTIAGVAAETEYSDGDMLLVQRAVFVGTAALDVYAEEESGQFRSWLSGASDVGLNGTPSGGWGSVTSVARPKFLSYRLDGLAA